MNTIIACRRVARAALLLACAGLAVNVVAAPLEPVMSLAKKKRRRCSTR